MISSRGVRSIAPWTVVTHPFQLLLQWKNCSLSLQDCGSLFVWEDYSGTPGKLADGCSIVYLKDLHTDHWKALTLHVWINKCWEHWNLRRAGLCILPAVVGLSLLAVWSFGLRLAWGHFLPLVVDRENLLIQVIMMDANSIIIFDIEGLASPQIATRQIPSGFM